MTRLDRTIGCMVLFLLGMFLPYACGPVELGHVSPLSGTWSAVSVSGGGFSGTVEFDFFGDLDSLNMVTINARRVYYVFDGQPHFDADGNQYVARATTTLDGSDFEVKGRIEYTEGKHEGVTRVTIAGVVEHGSMTGTVRIAYPDTESFAQDFKATKT